MFFSKKSREEKKLKQNKEEIGSIISGEPVRKVSKKEQSDKYIIANQQKAELQKEELINRLTELRRDCLRNPGFEDFEEDIQALIGKIKHGRNITNSNIQFAVDSFIVNKVNECLNYTDRDSVLATKITLNSIKSLIQDRNDLSSDLSKYTIKEYIQSRVQLDKYNVQKQVLQAEIADANNQIDELKAYGNMPEHKNEVQAIISNIKNIKSTIELKNKNINNLDRYIEQLNKVCISIESNINYQEIPGFDISSTIMDVATQNEVHSSHLEEVMEAGKELDSSLRDNNVSDKELTVGDASLNSEKTVDSYQDSLDELNSL